MGKIYQIDGNPTAPERLETQDEWENAVLDGNQWMGRHETQQMTAGKMPNWWQPSDDEAVHLWRWMGKSFKFREA